MTALRTRTGFALPRRSLALLGLALAPAASAQQPPPVHPLGRVEHVSKELLGSVSTVRALSDGRVLVNDLNGRKLALFDPTLGSFTVVADSTSATANAYSGRAGGLIAWKGDSTLFVDPAALSMLMIEPSGKIGRVMSLPRPNDAMSLIGLQGVPVVDPAGRLIYRAPPDMMAMVRRMMASRGSAGGPPAAPELPDSAAIIAVQLSNRAVDTIGWIRVDKVKLQMSQDANGRMSVTPIRNPLPQVDDWAVLADGSVALIRGLDYHIDWIRPTGARESTPKMPFQWQHLSDSEKVAFIDSTKAAAEKLRQELNARLQAGGAAALQQAIGMLGPEIAGMAAGAMAGGAAVMYRAEGRAGEGPPPRGDAPGRGGREGGPAQAVAIPPIEFVPPSELPDYAPPFTTRASRGDLDGNLWIKTTYGMNGGSVYDVVTPTGVVMDRVLVPPGRDIAGFGKGGVVYMGVREGTGVRLEMARVRKEAQP